MRFYEIVAESSDISFSEEDVTAEYKKKLKKKKSKDFKSLTKKTAGSYNLDLVSDFQKYTGRKF